MTKEELKASWDHLFLISTEKYKTLRWFPDDEKAHKQVFNTYINNLMEYICQNVNETTEKNTTNITQALNKRNEEQNVIEIDKQPKTNMENKPSKEKKLTMWAAIEQGTLAESVPE